MVPGSEGQQTVPVVGGEGVANRSLHAQVARPHDHLAERADPSHHPLRILRCAVLQNVKGEIGEKPGLWVDGAP